MQYYSPPLFSYVQKKASEQRSGRHADGWTSVSSHVSLRFNDNTLSLIKVCPQFNDAVSAKRRSILQ